MSYSIFESDHESEYLKLRVDRLDKEVGILRREMVELKDLVWNLSKGRVRFGKSTSLDTEI